MYLNFNILKYIIKFLQSHDNSKNKNSAFIISEHRLKTSALEPHFELPFLYTLFTKFRLSVNFSQKCQEYHPLEYKISYKILRSKIVENVNLKCNPEGTHFKISE